MKVFSNCNIREKIRIDCAHANCTATPDLADCVNCVKTNFTDFYAVTFSTVCPSCDMHKYFKEDATSGCDTSCVNEIIS